MLLAPPEARERAHDKPRPSLPRRHDNGVHERMKGHGPCMEASLPCHPAYRGPVRKAARQRPPLPHPPEHDRRQQLSRVLGCLRPRMRAALHLLPAGNQGRGGHFDRRAVAQIVSFPRGGRVRRQDDEVRPTKTSRRHRATTIGGHHRRPLPGWQPERSASAVLRQLTPHDRTTTGHNKAKSFTRPQSAVLRPLERGAQGAPSWPTRGLSIPPAFL